MLEMDGDEDATQFCNIHLCIICDKTSSKGIERWMQYHFADRTEERKLQGIPYATPEMERSPLDIQGAGLNLFQGSEGRGSQKIPMGCNNQGTQRSPAK